MSKITFIGAGSTVFAKNLLGDILAYPELARSTIALHDIDEERLLTTKNVANGSRWLAGRIRSSRCTPTAGPHLMGRIMWSRCSRSAGTVHRRSSTSTSLRSTACARRLPIHWASAGSCADCARSRSSSTLHRTWSRSAPAHGCSITSNPMAIITWAIGRATKIKTHRPVPQRPGHSRATGLGYRRAG